MNGSGTDARESILVLDIGTTNCKATLLGLDASLLGSARCAYPTSRPQPDWAEQSPAHWWEAVAKCVAALHAETDLEGVVAIVPTGQMHGLVAIDARGQPLGPCLTLGDHRGARQAESIQQRLGERRCYEITGAQIEGRLPVAKILWLRENQPDLYDQARCFLAPKDYLTLRLCGQLASEPIDAAGFGLLDLRTRSWSAEMLEVLGIPSAKLPPVLSSYAVAGPLLEQAAQTLSLRQGIPVVVGGGDDIECLGAGLIGRDVALEHLGSTGSMLVCVDEPILDPDAAFEVYPHAESGQWIVGGSTSAAGLALDWARRFLWADSSPGSAWYEPEPLPLASGRSPLVFLPHLDGARCPSWRDEARGVFVGLDLETDRRQAAQAVYEGVAFSLRSILLTLESRIGQVGSVVVSGTDAASPTWLQLRANIYGKRLEVSSFADTTSLGAMMLGAVAVGVFPSLSEAVRSLVSYTTRVSPNPQGREAWREHARTYDYLQASMVGLFPSRSRQQSG